MKINKVVNACHNKAMLYTLLFQSSIRNWETTLMNTMFRKICTISLLTASFLVAPFANAWVKDELVIWTKPDDFGNDGFKKLAQRFEKETGIKVTVVVPENKEDDQATRDYNRQVVLKRGPDIFLRTHDRVGELAQAGLIAQVKPSQSTLNSVNSNYWNAVSYDGKLYGYPIAVEGVTQICNADLVAKPYETLAAVEQDIPRLRKLGKKPLIWDYMNNYFSYGFVTSEGGFTFQFSNGSYNPAVTGANNRGAITGVTAIKRLLDKNLLPKKVDYGVVDNAFKQGQVACIVNGPWSWGDYEKAGIDLLIGNLPKVKSGTPKVFIGVLSAMLNPSSPNQVLASQFIEQYFTQPSGLKLINDDKDMGAVANKTFMKQLAKGNKKLAAASQVWDNGEPMPNIPKMSRYWTHMDTALYEVMVKDQSVAKSLNAAASRITR
ncbi:maltose/maltodextrin ABC transporter substrate-binding protein MalE [Saccharobesus litoralis]|nr:maltose/maltodextrin ABC transporter substrate-binding protein MalE [Saccharobesus litoralis]